MSKNVAKGGVIQQLIRLLKENKVAEFIYLINGVDLCRGSGAVWEVYIENEEDQTKLK